MNPSPDGEGSATSADAVGAWHCPDAGRPALLSVRDFRVTLGGQKVLHGIDLDLQPGEILGIAGPPGAGKSTLIKALSGAIVPDDGKLAVAGSVVTPGSLHEAMAAGMATIHQDVGLVPNLTAVENIVLGAEPHRRFLGVVPMIDSHAAWTEAVGLLRAVGVTLSPAQLVSPVRHLSGGQRQAIAIARALRTNPKLLLMDEPTAALGHTGREGFCDIIAALVRRGVGIVIVSHDIDMMIKLVHRIIVMRRGRIRAEGRPSTLDLDRLREEAGNNAGLDAWSGPGRQTPWYRFDLNRWISGARR